MTVTGRKTVHQLRDLIPLVSTLELHQIELEQQNQELRQARQDMEQLLKQYTELYDLAPVGYFTLDFSGTVLAVNLAGATLLGTERAALIGRSFPGLVNHLDRHAFEAFLLKTRDTTEKQELEIGLQRMAEGDLPLFVKLEALADSAGHTCLLAAIDMTKRKLAEEELDRYREQLEWLVRERTYSLEAEIAERTRAELEIKELNSTLERRVEVRTAELQATIRDLQTFSYSVSHDLRSPLRSINSFASMLLEDYGARLDEEGQRLLGSILRRTVSMGALIDDLLNFTKNSRLQLSLQVIDMTALARESVDKLQGNGIGGQTEFKIAVLPTARGDRAMIAQVLENLLGNAAKFSGNAGHPVVEVGCQVQEQALVYFVRDNGIGFEMKYADTIFGVFQRLHTSEDFEGTGVGLAIVEQVITKHGGKVWAEGRPGEGATFFFLLPRS
ncbi:sensor histidine kinase [Geomonas limicola]|nr:ATP-binding protein [Geomonas limicola]